MSFIIGVTTGLRIGDVPEMASALRKVGYALTRGTMAIELAGDVPHEVDYTIGKEIRYIAEKQGITITFHGSLTVPMTEGELERWSEAQDHMKKSIRSAVFCGAKYVDFHSCLYYWPELLTPAETKLRMIMVDWKGRFIKEILHENKDLREIFVEKLGLHYAGAILTDPEYIGIRHQAESEASSKIKAEAETKKISEEEIPKRMGEEYSKLYEKYLKEKIKEVLEKNREWDTRGIGNLMDVYRIVANYMFLTKDPLFVEMVKVYPKIKPDWKDKWWMEKQIERMEKEAGPEIKELKEFYYGVVGAKYLEGHMEVILNWIKKELPTEIKSLPIPKEEKEKLIKISKELKICIETPDARDPGHAGLYTLWRPRQVITAVKVIQKKLKTDKIWALIDFEHIATQGIDPSHELSDLINIIPNAGEYIYAVHVTHPNPLHSHMPIQIGEQTIYNLLWILRKGGLGKKHPVFLIFERGGGKDPFESSVTALKIMAEHLEKDIPPKELPEEFYGMPKGGPEFSRQLVAIREHALDPLKGLLAIPEEEHTFLSSAARDKGKLDEWRKERYR